METMAADSLSAPQSWRTEHEQRNKRGQGPATATCSPSLRRPSLERHDTQPRATKRSSVAVETQKDRCALAAAAAAAAVGRQTGQGPGEHLIHSCGRAINLFKHLESLCLSGGEKKGEEIDFSITINQRLHVFTARSQ